MNHYVYVLEQDGVIEYVGKGSGRRLTVQQRKFGMTGRIVKRFETSDQAYKFEKAHIAATNPVLNKYAGGNGSKNKRATRTPKDWLEVVEVGTKAYAAKLLLRFECMLSKETAMQVRRVLYAA